MKILIIEDEELAVMRLKQLIREIEPQATITDALDSVKSAIAHLKTNTGYDLIFLDIQLADGKSFAIFDEIKLTVPVIFTTAFDEYALQAFELNSIDYLLKPVNREKLKNAMAKLKNVREYYGEQNPNDNLYEIIRTMRNPVNQLYKDRFLISRGDTMMPLKTSEIACFYAEEKEVFVLTNDNKRYIIPFAIEELNQKLDPRHFFRANRQFIVAHQAIHKVHNYFNFKLKLEIIPEPKSEVIVSRARVAAFKAWMNGEHG